jgi:hypothetical protein
MYRSGHQWRVTAASYQNEAGQTIDLLNPYESQIGFSVKQTVSLRLRKANC